MDKLHQHILKVLRKSIMADMDVHNGIIKLLQSEYILTDIQIARIENGASKEEKAEILLDILPSCGPGAFDIFRQALKHHYEWLSNDMDKLEESVRSFCDIKNISTPTLPPTSPLTVVREAKIKQLQSYLEELQPNEYIVLHGMKGFGKSCLTASTLKNMKFVRNIFCNEVYWIKFGYKRPVDEEILFQLNTLYHRVKNLEIVPESLKPESLKDSLIYFLQEHFSREKHCHALLILDDVCDSKIIETFDFGCKTLVITADLDVVWEKRPRVIEMNDGFTETESLGLFAKVLDTEIENLPLEAKRIHDECKGMPLLIAMFSAQFKEFKHDMKLRPDRWKYYLNSLRNKDENNHVIKKFWEKQEVIFNMCIEQLPLEMRKRYEELVIFREDVNITPQTLEILWEGGLFQVEEMMLDLCHKSLAAKQWNDELRSYIYGVHDLLLCHLRQKFSKNELIQMHKSLIKKYHKYCNGDFSKLPADNYSHSYIGYHLEQAKLYDEFPNIYLDFDFIQQAIVHSGLNNLLIDLNNYRKYITKDCDPEYEKRFVDLEKFLEENSSTIAEHRRKKCLDIVQIAMSHPYPGYIKDTAIKLAKGRSKYLYLFHDKTGQIDIPLSEEMSTEICTSCFINDPNLILIGNQSGEIFLWYSIFKRQKVFNGHDKNSCIKKIIVCNEGDYFLSLDDRGIVKLFKIFDDENYEESNNAILSPRQKQSFWSGIFTSKIPRDDSSVIFSVPNEIILDVTFSHDSSSIAACTNKGTIRIWDCHGNILSNHGHNPQSSLKNIAFTLENNITSLLHIMDEIHGVIISYCKYGDKYEYISTYNLDLKKKKVIFFCSVPLQNNSLFIVTQKKAIYVKWFRSSNNHMHSYNKQVRASVENEKTVYVCASMTDDGQYIVLADSSGFINVWNINIGLHPITTYKSRVSSLDTYWLKDEGYHIICGSENRLLHKWKFPVEGTGISIKKPLFDAKVQNFGNTSDTIVMETRSNTIITLIGDDKIAETEQIDGKINNLILYADKIIYVTDKGMINMFDTRSKENIRILNFSSNVELITVLDIKKDIINNGILVCRGTDDNLQVWENIKLKYIIPNTGYVIAIHTIDQECLVTITRNGIITIWNIKNMNWLQTDRVNGNSEIIFSCLSYQKNFLAVLNENRDVVLYKLQKDIILNPAYIKIIECSRLTYIHKLTCCEISQNEKYLAIGFENGNISIIDTFTFEEIRKLNFHTSSVTQLHWAPSMIEIPILLSVSSDELIWWNITLILHIRKPKSEKRTVLSHSFSSPSVSKITNDFPHISTSQSIDSYICHLQNQLQGKNTKNDIDKLTKFWKSKEGKDPKQPGILAIVELPSNFFAKICVSTDFTKYVTVDIYGSISTFTLCGYD